MPPKKTKTKGTPKRKAKGTPKTKAKGTPKTKAKMLDRVTQAARAAKARVIKHRKGALKVALAATVVVLSAPAIAAVVSDARDASKFSEKKEDMLPFPAEVKLPYVFAGSTPNVFARFEHWVTQVEPSKECIGPQRSPETWLEYVASTLKASVCVNRTWLLKPSLHPLNIAMVMAVRDPKENPAEFNLVTFDRYNVNMKASLGWALNAECRTMPLKPLIIIPLVIRGAPYGASHANILIVNTTQKTVERFDPLGSVFTNELAMKAIASEYRKIPMFNELFNIDDAKEFEDTLVAMETALDAIIKKYVQQVFTTTHLDGTSETYEYTAPLTVCPNIAPQIIAQLGVSGCQGKGGLCVTWSLLYAHMRLLDAEMTADKFAREMKKRYTDKELLGKRILQYNTMIKRSYPYLFKRRRY